MAHGIPDNRGHPRFDTAPGRPPHPGNGQERDATVDEIASLMGGFAVALSWYNVLLMMIGVLLGVIIGVLLGLGGANGVAILLPLTFSMPPTSAIIMLSCIYW